jgi:predicted acyltransferase
MAIGDNNEKRLLSLDFFRGATMFLLIAEGTGLYESLRDVAGPNAFFSSLVLQFFHHPWHGLRFWDLIQPFFMFIVGVAMVFSLEKRWARGDAWMKTALHILIRCLILLLLGVMLHCVYSGRIVWELWNVLSQLSFTVLLAFLLFRLPMGLQLAITAVLLIATETAYRLFPVEGFNHPFVQGQNFGSWMDMVLMGKMNPDGWVAINCVPTACHTIWGVLAGQVLFSQRRNKNKLRLLALGGLACLVAGYGLDLTGTTPIIKRICTSSFILSSGGWCLLVLAASYWIIDILKMRKWTFFFSVVGMNSILIYLVGGTVGPQWFNGFVGIFTGGVMGWLGLSTEWVAVLTSLTVLALEWCLCLWLYRKKIFLRI